MTILKDKFITVIYFIFENFFPKLLRLIVIREKTETNIPMRVNILAYIWSIFHLNLHLPYESSQYVPHIRPHICPFPDIDLLL